MLCPRCALIKAQECSKRLTSGPDGLMADLIVMLHGAGLAEVGTHDEVMTNQAGTATTRA
jgi:hypothetical protein